MPEAGHRVREIVHMPARTAIGNLCMERMDSGIEGPSLGAFAEFPLAEVS